ncbi:MAG: lipopolysaccharide transport periplasmic protein LptA [Deltaproteobacteria bacterium]|nr:lipopolysaccharide transport periplasmic protein LptA [Deltaproteobacteria bacterium]
MFARSTERSSIVIKASSLEIDDNRKVVTFSGNVEAKEPQFTIKCDKLLVYYTEQKGKAGTKEAQLDIEKIVAKGNVNIIRDSGGNATAEQALYYHSEEKLVLTGNPVVRQGNDFVEGSKITLFLRENRSVVEGSGNKKVRAVLFPNRKEEKPIGQ